MIIWALHWVSVGKKVVGIKIDDISDLALRYTRYSSGKASCSKGVAVGLAWARSLQLCKSEPSVFVEARTPAR